MGDNTRKIKGYGSRVANTGGYKPFIKHEKGAGHSDQPSGKSVGYGSKRDYSKNEASGDGRQHSYQEKNPPANLEDGRRSHGHKQKHSSLAYKGNQGGDGWGTHGLGGKDSGTSFKGRVGRADAFKNANDARGTHGYRHEGGLRGNLRMSGDPRAHRIGDRRK